MTLGIHRATVFRWLSGIRLKGLRGFERHMRSCHAHLRRRRTHQLLPALVVECRNQYGFCGAKIVWWLREEHGLTVSESTVYRILRQHFRLRSKWKKNQLRGPVPKAAEPGQVIQVDTVNLGSLFVLTAIDTFTRQALALPLRSLATAETVRSVPVLCRFFGPVEVLQTDNGGEFKGAFARATRSWAETHRYARPGTPNEQGFVESFNRTLRKHGIGWQRWEPGQFGELAELLERFCHRYNHRIPHLSLGLLSPVQFAQSHLTRQ